MIELTAVVPPSSGPGHGECFVWKGRRGAPVIAVDAGGAADVGKRAGAHAPEILILSHDDNDHIRGAVHLISTAKQSLKELWVPVEWALLVRQIADTGPDDLLPESADRLNIEEFEATVANQIIEVVDSGDGMMSRQLLGQASENLSSWSATEFGDDDGFSIEDPTLRTSEWYGAKNLDEIIQRVRFRANTLINILSAAIAESIIIRFFSIDLAMSRSLRTWESEGRPGVVTVANASEHSQWLSVLIPPGLLRAFALTLLTVQNRRALCTLLWCDATTPDGGAIIWSDTDGNWLNHSSPLGLSTVVRTVKASSAPHHASANPAHNRVWAELSGARDDMVMICAGGQRNQGYRSEYLALQQQRSCTWCRPNQHQYQEIRASWGRGSSGGLHNSCLVQH